MSTDVVLPPLGESVAEATISRWLKAVGDDVVADEPLLEVSTDKVDTEIPSPATGVLLQVFFNEDDTARVGDVLAVIGVLSDGYAPPPPPTAPQRAIPMFATPPPVWTPSRTIAPPVQPDTVQPDTVQPAAPRFAPRAEPLVASDQTPTVEPSEEDPSEDEVPYVTPAVRKLADNLSIDLADVHGTGVGGRVRKQDLLNAAATRAAQRRGTTRPLVAHAPRGTLSAGIEVDVTSLDPDQFFGEVIAAVAAALRDTAEVNATIIDDVVVYHDHENIGLVISTHDGPLTPVIHDAFAFTAQQLEAGARDLAARAANNELDPEDLADGTFTVQNDGASNVAWAIAAINRPQVAALSIGRVAARPAVVAGQIVVRDRVWMTLTYDRRVVNPTDAAAFLNRLRNAIGA